MIDVIASNKRRAALLVAAFVMLVVLIGALAGLLFDKAVLLAASALVKALLVVALSFWKADAIALRMSRAELADPSRYQRLYNIVEGLCVASGLSTPDVYVVDDPAPNAFVVGRDANHASIAFTTGLLDQLERVELEGVVAQQLSRIRNHEVLVSTLAVTIVGGLALLCDLALRTMWWNGGRVSRRGDRQDSSNPLGYLGFALYGLAPILGRIMRATVPATRNTVADVNACQITRYPPGLIAALEKLDGDTTVTHSASTATAHLWLEQPMSGVGDAGRLDGVHRAFATHPPLSERIALLREL